MSNNGLLYLAYDADAAGQKVGRAILADDPNFLKEISDRITLGNEIVAEWAKSWGGITYSSGGDQGMFTIPQEALESIEELRKDYEFTTNLTMTVGVGATLSEAGKSLLVGKFRGKNMVVIYDENVEKELAQAQKNVEDGTASPEERKLSEAYLKPEDKGTKPREEQLLDYSKDGSEPPQIDKPDPKTEPKQEVDAPVESPSMNNNPGEHDKENQNKHLTPRDEENQSVDKENAEDRAIESNNQQVENKHSEAAMRAIAEAIEGDEAPGQTEKDQLAHVDDEDLAIGDEMEGNTSRPDGYKDQNKPGDMGLAEEDDRADEPDLSSVLKDGLDSHAENMQREKVVDMVSQALEGFRANKHILEKAKEKAPELYQSCLSMLKAMIEMAEMLGIGQDEDQENPLDEQKPDDFTDPTTEETHPSPQSTETDQEEQAAAYGEPTTNNEEEQAATHEDDCPYCKPSDDECPHCVAMEEQAAKSKAMPASDGLAIAPKFGGKKSDSGDDEKESVGQGLGKLPTKNTTRHVAKEPIPEGGVNAKGQKKITDPKTGRVRFINMREGKVASPTGVPVKPNGTK